METTTSTPSPTSAHSARSLVEQRLATLAQEIESFDVKREALAKRRDDLIRELVNQHGATQTTAAQLSGMSRMNVSLILAPPERKDRLKKDYRDARRSRRRLGAPS